MAKTPGCGPEIAVRIRASSCNTVSSYTREKGNTMTGKSDFDHAHELIETAIKRINAGEPRGKIIGALAAAKGHLVLAEKPDVPVERMFTDAEWAEIHADKGRCDICGAPAVHHFLSRGYTEELQKLWPWQHHTDYCDACQRESAETSARWVAERERLGRVTTLYDALLAERVANGSTAKEVGA